MSTALAYKGRADGVAYTLKRNGIALTAEDMALITKHEFKFNGNYYNSEDHASLFSIDVDSATITIYPGLITDVVATTDRKVEIIVYDASRPQGFVWGTISLKVSGDAVPAT